MPILIFMSLCLYMNLGLDLNCSQHGVCVCVCVCVYTHCSIIAKEISPLYFFFEHLNLKLFYIFFLQFSSVQSNSHVQLFATPWITAHQASLSITNSNTRPLSRWCHPTIPSSVVPTCSQSLPESESFPMNQLFPWGGQNTRVSAFASFLPMNTQDWFPIG